MTEPFAGSAGQARALRQLQEIAAAGPHVEILEVAVPGANHGLMTLTVALDCSGLRPGNGIRVRARERFDLVVGGSFPFEPPAVCVRHRRWAGAPHVQWGGQLCLYAAPTVEWDPGDGMRGLLERLTRWLDRAAAGTLDPDDQPLHPPVAYPSASGVVVVRADLGDDAPTPATLSPRHKPEGTSRLLRLLVAIGECRGGGRVDVMQWVSLPTWKERARQLPASPSGSPAVIGMLAVLADREFGFEYPGSLATLVAQLEEQGLRRDVLLDHVGQLTFDNLRLAGALLPEPPQSLLGPSLYVLLGTPSRRPLPGQLRQHVVCWRADSLADLAFISRLRDSPDPEAAADGQRARQHAEEMITTGTAEWVTVMEARPEVTVRRDHRTSASWLDGKNIIVLGCGALGAPMAEHCLRAGAATVWAVDNGTVQPGILVRQPYSDDDIGIPKAQALAKRLNGIGLPGRVEPLHVDAKQLLADGTVIGLDADLVIDATADVSVRSALELSRSRQRDAWPTLLTALVGHDAQRGVIALSRPGATGGGRDVLRRLRLAAGPEPDRLGDVDDDFWPGEQRMFQPEPGCSSPTFVGSHIQLSFCAAGLLHAGLSAIAGEAGPGSNSPMAAAIVRLPGVAGGRTDWLFWLDDHLVRDDSGIEMRFAAQAMSQIRSETRRGRRVRSRNIETGGMLLGELDEACECLWIDTATGPPPDSELSSHYFLHGVDGVEQLISHHSSFTNRVTTYQGMWHIHPDGAAQPSRTDRHAMHALVDVRFGVPRAALVILGGTRSVWDAWLDDGQVPDMHATVVRRKTVPSTYQNPEPPPSHRTQAWTGGWSTSPSGSPPTSRSPRRRRRWRRLRLR